MVIDFKYDFFECCIYAGVGVAIRRPKFVYDEFILPPGKQLCWAFPLILQSYDDIPPFLCCKYPGSPEEIEGHLPEEGIDGILDQPGEPGPEGVVVEMGEAEILFDYVPDFRDVLVTFFFEGC